VRRQPLIYFLFLCSGLSGLIYQVVWVRVFGNVFGNTVYSASLVVAVFMLGLGAGSYVIGGWADRRQAVRPGSLPAAYGMLELAIGAIGLAISALLPRLVELSARVSSYAPAPNGWYILSASSYLARVAIAVALLTPITLLMGGTLTLLISHFVREDLDVGSRRIAMLYAVNTAGAALGCFLTDFLLVPAFGLLGTQFVAVSFNLIAAGGAFLVARNVWLKPDATGQAAGLRRRSVQLQPDVVSRPSPLGAQPSVGLTSLALALSGFAAMGTEILWFRHVSILLGGFRAVFSLLMTVILAGIGGGALAAGVLHRRVARPAVWLMVVQGLFVALSLLGLAAADARAVEHAVTVDRAFHVASGPGSNATRTLQELWFNTRPILLEVGLPALLMGFGFPLANALTQRADRAVGRRAGVLYLSNTCGAVCGSLAAGFVLLPTLGIQGSATVLATAAAMAIVPLSFATRPGRGLTGLTVVALTGGVAAGAWLLLPPDYLIDRAAPALENERLIARSEGLTEVVAVTEAPSQGRTLLTNGHPMSSTSMQSQRYMRALAHVPLLSIDRPEAVLVIGFGVGNTAHAATLHPSIRRVEVADLSRGVLDHAGLFNEVNRDVLSDPRVAVYVNDGRHHLQMQPPASYDLITLEPPPIGYAGVAALYSTEFYALARSRLKPGGYLSQWLPAYQVPAPVTLAMVRAFVDVFPQTVLISGAEADLLLLGANDSRIEIDPARVSGLLAKAPAVQADLQRLDMGSPREIVGAFVGSAGTLAQATRDITPVSDDRPIQEYGVRSLLDFGEAVPASIVDLRQVTAWCPTCFVGGKPAPEVDGLDTYLALADSAYRAPPVEVARARDLAGQHGRVVAGSAYLGALVPESADVHNILGIALADRGRIDEAIAEFRAALRLDPGSAQTHWHLGAALAYRGARDEAVDHLRESVRLDPGNANARHDLEVLLTLDPRR
jgi:spermidine synthase